MASIDKSDIRKRLAPIVMKQESSRSPAGIDRSGILRVLFPLIKSSKSEQDNMRTLCEGAIDLGIECLMETGWGTYRNREMDNEHLRYFPSNYEPSDSELERMNHYQP